MHTRLLYRYELTRNHAIVLLCINLHFHVKKAHSVANTSQTGYIEIHPRLYLEFEILIPVPSSLMRT